MRVRVKFRIRPDTGEVEAFVVEDLGGRTAGVDHDAVHDRAAADVARIIERNALIEEFRPGAGPSTEPGGLAEPGEPVAAERGEDEERGRTEGRRLT